MEREDEWREKEGWREKMNGARRWREKVERGRDGLKECSLQYHCHGALPILALKR